MVFNVNLESQKEPLRSVSPSLAYCMNPKQMVAELLLTHINEGKLTISLGNQFQSLEKCKIFHSVDSKPTNQPTSQSASQPKLGGGGGRGREIIGGGVNVILSVGQEIHILFFLKKPLLFTYAFQMLFIFSP